MSESSKSIRTINLYCVDCNQYIQEIPKKKVKINFLRCKECYKKSVTFYCQYPSCKQKLRSSITKYCLIHDAKTKADKKAAEARAMEEKRRKKLEIPDPLFSNNWQFPESQLFHSGVDLFEIYTVLDVNPQFTKQQVKAAYRVKALALHPDKNPREDTTDQFQQLQEVYKQALSLFDDST